jgi:fructan beta-fructosidase
MKKFFFKMNNKIIFTLCVAMLLLTANNITMAAEPFRPAYHFTPQKNWCNDPNGMVWYAGEYHLFYQYNPQGTKWGNMSWGHAVSIDLVTWKHLPVALFPDNLGDIFSGSAVVDENNTAGFQTGDEKTLLAFYTYNKDSVGQSQALAYSVDKGRNWTKYAQNPVITVQSGKPDFRDPKVFWYAPESKWIMALAVGQVIEFYSSKNAKDWIFESEFGAGYGCHDAVWECPDLFYIPPVGETKGAWVLLVNNSRNGENSGSATQYFIGNFDGENFVCEQPAENAPALWLDYGKDHYAMVTWANAPDNRKIGIAWMSNWEYANDTPTEKFRGAMSVPRELTLVNENGKYLLTNFPVKEVEKLRGEASNFSDIKMAESRAIKNLPASGVYEILLDFEKQNAQKFGFILKNSKDEKVTLSFDFEQNRFTIDRTKSGIVGFHERFAAVTVAPLAVKNAYRLRVLVDKCSVEAFLNGGEVAMTNLVFPNELYNEIEFLGDAVKINNLKIIKVQ